ncbi:MAG: DNA starvation/stationary phase protection protein [Alphaproteobacteria bacterium]|nr:DNA starvation/stationary phase protection protein [Alphaproteobacteria bacterium]
MAKSSSAKSSANANKREVARILNQVLSDTYVILVKTHGYHWNVVGPHFRDLHKLLESQYEALFEAVDEIAERVRALDELALGSMKSFLAKTSIKESPETPPDAKGMVRDLLAAHENLHARLMMAEEVTGRLNDPASNDLMVQRIQECDKMAWMLRSFLA